MKKNGSLLTNTILFFIATQFIFFLLVSFLFGLNHPLYALYSATNIYIYIIVACLVTVPFYLLAGGLAVLVRNRRTSLLPSFKKTCYLGIGFYTLFLVVAIALRYFNISDYWIGLYIISNYPVAFSMIQLPDTQVLINPIFLLTAIVPSVSFYFGARLRINYLRRTQHEES